MSRHNANAYRVQWPKSNPGEVITEEEVYEDVADDDVIEEEYLVGEEIIPTNEINAISNTLDQSAAQNLIYMAQEGNVAMGDLIEEQVEQAENGDYNDQEYFECQVTEEVITDDWVQRQGEERIEIIIDSIASARAQEAVEAHADDEIDVSLPTIQDEYLASRPYPCDFCSRRFRKKANLINHMVAHQQERPHVCHLCGARYIRKSDLIQHLKIHAYVPDEEQLASESDRGASTQRSTSGGKRPRGSGGLGKSKPGSFERYIEEDEEEEEGGSQSQDSDSAHRPEAFPVLDEKRPFVCQQCGLAFSREKALLSHTKIHGPPYECSHCGEGFYSFQALNEHEATHNEARASSSKVKREPLEYFPDQDYESDEAEDTRGQLRHAKKQRDSEDEEFRTEEFGIYYCDHCGMSFHRVNLLRQHVKTHLRQIHPTDSHACLVCGEKFSDSLDLLAHAEIHASNASVKCSLCGEEVVDDQRLEQHVTTVHKMELTASSCRVCGKQCRDEKALRKHSYDHTTSKATCPICNKTFLNKARMKRHLQSHRKRTVTCDICMEEFEDGRSLMNHRHSHSTALVKRFPCKECGKSFGSRSSQQIHVRMHTGERPYGCRFCWKSFADGGTLRKHERIHTGEKPYGCVICPRAFNQRVVLREHIKSHHSGPDPSRSHLQAQFHCPLCDMVYNKPEDLISDLIAHCDENTKRQRPVQVGPRKYKRRRKLKPHELKILQGEHQVNLPTDDEEDPTLKDLFSGDPLQESLPPQRGGKRKMEPQTEPEDESDMMFLSEPEPTPGQSKTRATAAANKKVKPSAAESPLNSAGRPKMIHTEKSRLAPADGRRRGTTVTTRTATATAAAPSTSTRRSKRTAEAAEDELIEMVETEEDEDEVEIRLKKSGDGLEITATELADVLENKKKDKYKLDIVNDLESILRSPVQPRVSECSATGAELDVDVDGGEPKKKLGQSTIECRKSYIPSASDKKLAGKPYQAKIATVAVRPGTSAQFGIVKVIKGAPGAVGKVIKVVRPKGGAATKAEGTLDDLLRGGAEGDEEQEVEGGSSHQCQICDEVLTDKTSLIKHAKTHF